MASGMNKVHASDKSRRKNEEIARRERKDEVLHKAIYGEDAPVKESEGRMKVARTVGQLQDQLESDLRGEKDMHDFVIDSYESRARQAYEHRQQQLERLRASVQNEGGTGISGVVDFRGLSRSEVEERMAQRRRESAQQLGNVNLPPEMVDAASAERAERWLTSKGLSGPDPTTALTASNRPQGKPWKQRGS